MRTQNLKDKAQNLTVFKSLNKAAKGLTDLLFPVKCLGCGKKGNFICPTCLTKIPLNRKIFLEPGKNSPLSGLIVASDYNDPLLKQIIFKYKYNFVKDLSLPLGQLMVQTLSDPGLDLIFGNAVIMPVPLHKKRLKWRGFNQSELLAKEVGQKFNLPVISILTRVKNTVPQMGISGASERKENIKNAFAISMNSAVKLRDKNIVLVDDIATTAATLSECASSLKPLEPRNIWGLVLARG